MVNTRAKGNRIQRKCIEVLEREGWRVDKVEKTGRYTKDKDLFNLWDLCCVNGQIWKFIQVTCNRPHTHGQYKDFAELHASHYVHLEQWVHYDKKGWVKFRYHKSLGMDKTDERK